MLGKQHDRLFILGRVLLDQIFHGLNQEALPLDVSGIMGLRTFPAAAARWIRKNRYGEDLSHDTISDAGSCFSVARIVWEDRKENKGSIFTQFRGSQVQAAALHHCGFTTFVLDVFFMLKTSSGSLAPSLKPV